MNLQRDFDVLAEQAKRNNIINHTFKLPATSQMQSPLMQLPAEIRQMIWQQLLMRSEPLSSKVPVYRPVRKPTKRTRLPRKAKAHASSMLEHNWVFTYGFTPEIMATCQNILRESWHLLYTQNAPVVSFKARYQWEFNDPGRGEPEFSVSFGDKEAPRGWSFTGSFGAFDSWLYQTFGHCEKFHFHFTQYFDKTKSYPLYTDLTDVLRRIQNLLRGKELYVSFRCLDDSNPDPPIPSHLIGCARVFQLLRCRSFIFGPGQTETWEAVADTVMSDRPVIDLPRMCNTLEDHVEDFQVKCRGYDCTDAWNILREAQLAAEDYDVDLFVQKRTELIVHQKNILERSIDQLHEHDVEGVPATVL